METDAFPTTGSAAAIPLTTPETRTRASHAVPEPPAASINKPRIPWVGISAVRPAIDATSAPENEAGDVFPE